ncbi:MAG: ABC transporter permease, partial [Acidobacteria bacterium]|nr:ABC transporter permease [Acidobacteriota bacterium]
MTLFRRRDREEDLREEIDTHLALAEEEYRRAGMSPADARDAAQRNFGGVLKTREAHREQRSFRPLDLLLQDIRFAFRVLTRDRGFTVMAILVLGIGIGVNNMMFTIIYTHTLRGLPMDDVGRVLYVSAFDDRTPDSPLSYSEFEDVRLARSFSGVAAFVNAPMTLADDGRAPDRFDGSYVSANAFEVAAITPVAGRPFTTAEETSGAPVALLGAGAWRSRYGADASILGRTVIVNGTHVTVVGIVPERSGFPSTAEVWLPLSRTPNLARDRRDARTLRVFGRMRDGVSEAAAKADVESIIATDARLKASVIPINQRFLGRPTDPAWLAFMTAGFLVLVVSCANVANLLLARAVVRAREFAIRGSLGARRLRIAGQLLVESLVLATMGAAVGVAVSVAGVRVFASAVPQNTLPYWLNYDMDARVFGALVAVSFLAVLVFGLVPALQGSRVDVNRVLKDGGRTGTGRGSARRLTTGFLVAELALTIVLVANVVTAFRNNTPPLPSDTRINSRELVVASVTLPSDKYSTPQQRAAFYGELDERLRGDALIAAAAIASVPPGPGGTEQRLEVEGRPL